MVWGGGGVGYYASISMWRWYLHVFVGSYLSFGRSEAVGREHNGGQGVAKPTAVIPINHGISLAGRIAGKRAFKRN